MKKRIIIATIDNPSNSGGIKTAFIMKKEKDDLPHNISRFSVTQVPDFSFSDGATIQGFRPADAKEKTKTVIENTNPEL